MHATAIAEKGFDRLIEFARPGMTESAIAVELNCFTKSLGADDNFLMLSCSPHNSAVMPSSSRKLEHRGRLAGRIQSDLSRVNFLKSAGRFRSARRAPNFRKNTIW